MAEHAHIYTRHQETSSDCRRCDRTASVKHEETRRVGDEQRCATTCNDETRTRNDNTRTESLVADCLRRTDGRACSHSRLRERSADRHARCYGNQRQRSVTPPTRLHIGLISEASRLFLRTMRREFMFSHACTRVQREPTRGFFSSMCIAHVRHRRGVEQQSRACAGTWARALRAGCPSKKSFLL